MRAIVGVVIRAPGVYPTPIYESLAALALFAVLWILRGHSHRPGFLFSLYLLLAGFERLLIENTHQHRAPTVRRRQPHAGGSDLRAAHSRRIAWSARDSAPSPRLDANSVFGWRAVGNVRVRAVLAVNICEQAPAYGPVTHAKRTAVARLEGPQPTLLRHCNVLRRQRNSCRITPTVPSYARLDYLMRRSAA